MEFNVTIRKEPEVLLDKVCLLAQDKVLVSGDVNKGEFSGLFRGSYLVSGKSLNVYIQRKPFFVSWDMVKRGLNYLAV